MATNGSAGRGSARSRPSTAVVEAPSSAPKRRAPRDVSAEDMPDTSARRVLKILLYLAQHQRPVLASAIARDCHFPRSSTYRLLHVMEDMAFVTYYPDEGRWGLGLSSYELGTGYLLSDPLARQSMSILVKLAAQTGAFMAIGVLDGTEVIVSRAHHPESTTAWSDFEPGVRYPAHLTAMGRALLLDRPRGELVALYGDRPLARPNGRGPATIDELLEQLEEAKERGYAESPVDLADGIWAFAAPVYSAARRVVAALTAGFLGEPPKGEDFDRTIAALLSGAEEISSRLGYRPCDPPAAG
jgi:DNA-binding IclR family transcriptional regulator